MTQFALPGFARIGTMVKPSLGAWRAHRVMRWIRAGLALKSALAGLLILAWWARSYHSGDSFRRGTETQYVQLGSASGSVLIRFVHDGTPTRLLGSWARHHTSAPRDLLIDAGLGETAFNRIGLGFNSDLFAPPRRGMIVNIMLPHWLVFLLAIPSAVKWVRRRRKEPAPVEPAEPLPASP